MKKTIIVKLCIYDNNGQLVTKSLVLSLNISGALRKNPRTYESIVVSLKGSDSV